ncbi:uncharacterized protein LOC114937353 [Nylanderia fulva]|uniref:uncharacterized protein LOC114937353 n=1 Tax=Nylanderia fulva TaxID=613905 RepID=UPI0010FB1378|nr:uncharacterized protein LOC114937353 [Nylanderia fulva]
MDVSPKNSHEQCFSQEKEEISKNIDSSVGKNQNENIENATYIPYRNLISSSASISHIGKKISDRKTEVALLKQEPAGRQLIELSDSDSKMMLRQQFAGMAESESNLQHDGSHYENMEILRKLPPDTVVIRQETRTSREDSDCRELIETNSSGSSSTSGCIAAKAKRFIRARKKTRDIVEVRRNPMRVSKKNKEFPPSKQRLLVNSRKEICANYESAKHIKSVTMPYMKTRSVTRKMYTVGATYQAPTKKDETEWKEWPAHGMHERPVFHPQAGLAVEYLGRYFTSLDGFSLCEIIDEPEIEVVAVDPHRDRRASSAEKKPKRRTRVKGRGSSNPKVTWNAYFSGGDTSFETCMHGSLHCVLGYCSQVMAPVYKQAVEEQLKLTGPAFAEAPARMANFKPNQTASSSETAKLIEAIAVARNKNIPNRRRPVATCPSSSATFTPEAQNSSKMIPQSGETIGMNLKRILRDASCSSLILLRNSEKASCEDSSAKDSFGPAKLEDVKTPSEVSSIYKNLVFAGKPVLEHEKSSTTNNLYTLKRYSANTTKKTFLEDQLENEKTAQVVKESHKGRSYDKMRIVRESADEVLMMKNSTNETSEIARILSEYNSDTLRKSASHNRIYDSSANKALPKNIWQKGAITAEENPNFVIPDGNSDLDLTQEKWKRYNSILGEKIRNSELPRSVQNSQNSCSMSSDQFPLVDRQMSLNKYIREKSAAKSCKERKIVVTEAKLEQKGTSFEDEIMSTTEPLQELLENTAILYCAATGIHQDDLSNYIDTLDSKQSIQWLESWNNSVV